MNDSSPPLIRKGITNPYAGIPKSDLVSCHCSVLRSDQLAIRTIIPTQGILQATIAILWKTLVEELHLRGIKGTEDEKEFESFLCDLKLTTNHEYDELKRNTSAGRGLFNGPASGFDTNSNPLNDRGTTSQPRSGDTQPAPSTSNVQSKGRRGRKSEGEDKTKEGGQ